MMSSDEPFLFRTFGDASKEVVCFCSGGPDHTLDFSDDFCAALAVNGFFVMKFAQSKKMNYPVVSFMGILIRFSVSEFLLQSTPIGIFLGVVAARDSDCAGLEIFPSPTLLAKTLESIVTIVEQSS